jgi:hypothetical protein
MLYVGRDVPQVAQTATEASAMKLNFFHERTAEPALSFGVSDLHILGDEISGFMSSRATARYTEMGWHYAGRRYAALVVTGGGCLLFGTRHALTFMSDQVEHFYFLGACLSANGVAVAKFDPQSRLWRGIERQMWCHSWHIVSPAGTPLTVVDRIARLNPWEPDKIPPFEAVELESLVRNRTAAARWGLARKAIEMNASLSGAGSSRTRPLYGNRISPLHEKHM